MAVGIHGGGNFESSSDLLSEVGRKRGAEDKGAGVIDEVLLQFDWAADERAGTGESFAAGVNAGKKLGVNSDLHGEAAACWTVNCGGVSFIDDERGAIFFSESGDLLERGDIAIHAEDSFGNNDATPRCARFLTESGF